MAVLLGATAGLGLWWWSAGSGDPLAPGGVAPEGHRAGALTAGAPPGEPGSEVAGGTRGSGGAEGTGGAALSEPSDEALAAVRAAAAATEAVSTAQFHLTVAPSEDPASVPLTEVSGVVDVREGAVSMALRQWDPTSSSATSLEAVAIGDSLYVRSAALDLPGERSSWWRVRVGPGDDGPPAAVSELVGLVGSAVAAELVGPGLENGVEVTRYRVQLGGDGRGSGFAGSAAGWGLVGVDETGRLRTIEVRAAGTWGAAAGQPVVVRLRLDGLGEAVQVAVPQPDAVRELAGSAPGGGG